MTLIDLAPNKPGFVSQLLRTKEWAEWEFENWAANSLLDWESDWRKYNHVSRIRASINEAKTKVEREEGK